MTYSGSCHCGAVQYEVETDLEKTIECNCSHCAIKGLILTFVPAEKVTMRTDGALSEYFFNKKHISHQFCPVCGVETFGRGTDPEGKETYGINVRCLKDVDLAALNPTSWNGKDY